MLCVCNLYYLEEQLVVNSCSAPADRGVRPSCGGEGGGDRLPTPRKSYALPFRPWVRFHHM